MSETQPRVIAVGPMPPEKSAYALARYSRSADSIRQSIEWVRTHDSAKFLESFYFQYGHASIADLGHLALCFEGISELAATEIEDEPLWDGQAKSSRYQDFGKLGVITPPEFSGEEAARYQAAAGAMIAAYQEIHQQALASLKEKLPRPDNMKPDAYERNLAARAFDIARYLLPFGVPTNVGQVTSIRTLEKQIRRMKASEYGELRSLGEETAAACAREPECRWDTASSEAIAPTLAKYVDPDTHVAESRAALKQWAAQNLRIGGGGRVQVDLVKPTHTAADIVATLLYGATHFPYRWLYETALGWSEAQRAEVIDVALASRTRRDELLSTFRSGPYVYDIPMDIGAYRDLHRHRRCIQARQPYSAALGYVMPKQLAEARVEGTYRAAMEAAYAAARELPEPGSHYLLPFGARGRFLFKMDFAEAEYISRLRSGVKGHFSYREVAWEMKERMVELEPELGRLMKATPPWEEDPLTR